MSLFNKKTDDSKKSAAKPAKDAAAPSMKDLYQGTASTTATKSGDKAQAGVKREFHRAHRVLVRPLITEKAANLGVINKYVFAVATDTNKIEVAKAVEATYGIKPTGVTIINMAGKRVRSGRIKGQRQDWKKAIVTLPAGKTINLYEGV
jgi:large subunit ribosomal protein L23